MAQYIVTRPIMDLCMAENKMTGPRVAMWFREQEGLDLEGIQTASQEAERTEGEEETERTETEKDN